MNTNTETMSPAELQETLDRGARYLYDILQARADEPTASRDDVLVAEAALRHWQSLAAVAALIAERDALRDASFIRTGAFDRNGREILAGDRVRYLGKSEYTNREYWFPEYVVEWSAPRFRLRHTGGDKDNSSAHFAFEHTQEEYWSSHLEVIAAARAEARNA